MNKNQKNIIKEWEKTKIVHPSYGEIAKKLNLSKSYVVSVVKKYLAK
jgi:DNA-binding MarR family transcriptional regulator